MKVTVCMVVGDDLGAVEAIRSAVPIADDFVVILTGANESTNYEIFEGVRKSLDTDDTPILMVKQPWEGNFSLHRNEAIKYAPSDLIITLDADERISIEDPEAWRAAIEDKPLPADVGALAVRVVDCNMDWSPTGGILEQPRIFVASHNPHYEGKIHNRPRFEGRCARTNAFEIQHRGYHLPEEQMAEKRQQRLAMLMEAHQENPNDWDIRYYLAVHTSAMGDLQAAENWAHKYLAETPIGFGGYQHGIHYVLANVQLAQGKLREAKESMLRGLQNLPKDPDLWMLASDIAVREGNVTEAADAGWHYTRGLLDWFENGFGDKPRQIHYALVTDQWTATLRYTIGAIAKADWGMADLEKMGVLASGIPQEVTAWDLSDLERSMAKAKPEDFVGRLAAIRRNLVTTLTPAVDGDELVLSDAGVDLPENFMDGR